MLQSRQKKLTQIMFPSPCGELRVKPSRKPRLLVGGVFCVVSVPLRGIESETIGVNAGTGQIISFPSPCGELRVKHDNTVSGLTATSIKFPSPCGELRVKPFNLKALWTLAYRNQIHRGVKNSQQPLLFDKRTLSEIAES